MSDPIPLEQQRRNALRFELGCFALALLWPAAAAYLLRDKLETMQQIPVSFWVPLIPPLLLFLAGIGFHRHRKAIERRL